MADHEGLRRSMSPPDEENDKGASELSLEILQKRHHTRRRSSLSHLVPRLSFCAFSQIGSMLRRRQMGAVPALLFLFLCSFTLTQFHGRFHPAHTPVPPYADGFNTHVSSSHHENNADSLQNAVHDYQPRPVDPQTHPIGMLIRQAEVDLEKMKARQSRTLQDAVAEYGRRYKMPPPPNFDKWYAYAKARDVQVVDEFDLVHEQLLPFWGLKPATIRRRATEALGYDNALLSILIRNGTVRSASGGRPWQREATKQMLENFVQFLPDMDLAFNTLDEPRVVLQHDDLSRLVGKALKENIPAVGAKAPLLNQFSGPAEELSPEDFVPDSKKTRFITYSHQSTWTTSRMSCPPHSPARILEEEEADDDRSGSCVHEFCFVSNETAYSDVCLAPSLRTTYGFFDKPNSFSVSQDLVPVFSQSKLSTYSDILYPSPWYWAERVPYNETEDIPWAQKKDDLYWRGSTTGGYSRWGGWRRHHRQRFVRLLNGGDEAKVLQPEGDLSHPTWNVKEVARTTYKSLVDVAFSHVGQCDPGDCAAQREFFRVAETAEQSGAWSHKYLLDMDGNAFSGRFYAFLQSHSLVFKFAIFREWHAEWLRGWAHYIPATLQGDELLEAMRYFHEDPVGRGEAERVAQNSRAWAGKVVRKEDMETWLFRLLLEYGRVIDDNRETIGYAL